MIALHVVTVVALAVSLIASRPKTADALKLAARRLAKILPAFLAMLVLFSATITLLPQEVVMRLLGKDSGWQGVAIASAAGSVTLMPGFIAFPLCGELLKRGVQYMVLAGMTVGVCRIPMTMFELSFMGPTFTAVRLVVSIPLVIVMSVVMGRVLEWRDYEVTE